MEKEPHSEREPYTFRLAFEDSEFACNPHNTMAFLHSQEPQGDHLFLFRMDNQQLEWGRYLFRRSVQDFDTLIEKMRKDYKIVERDILNDEDREAYDDWVVMQSGNITSSEVQPTTPSELTPRQERLANFVAYLLLHEHLSAEDFNGQGDLYI